MSKDKGNVPPAPPTDGVGRTEPTPETAKPEKRRVMDPELRAIATIVGILSTRSKSERERIISYLITRYIGGTFTIREGTPEGKLPPGVSDPRD